MCPQVLKWHHELCYSETVPVVSGLWGHVAYLQSKQLYEDKKQLLHLKDVAWQYWEIIGQAQHVHKHNNDIACMTIVKTYKAWTKMQL